jgi:hypothetical protein
MTERGEVHVTVEVREPIPPGVVSTIRGRWQRPALTIVTWSTSILAAVAVVLPGPAGRAVGAVVVTVIVAAPLLRVAWLAYRWWQEADRRFVVTALALLAVVAAGASLALAGVGT